jgi:hypothetical protein
MPKRKGVFELRRSVVPVEIVDGLSEVAGALIIGSKGDQWDERRTRLTASLAVGKLPVTF